MLKLQIMLIFIRVQITTNNSIYAIRIYRIM